MDQHRRGACGASRDNRTGIARNPEDVRLLQGDRRLADTINRFARRTAVGAAAHYGDGIVRLASDTIRGWDTRTITGRLENAVGRDLQYIRINGTIVGGLVGVLIHVVDVAL